MKLQVSQLHEGENPLEFRTEKSEALRSMIRGFEEKGHRVVGEFLTDLRLTKLEPNYYLKGRLRFELSQECSRCAETFSFPVEHRFELGLVHLANGKPQRDATLAEESEELDLNWFGGNELDLGPILEEQFYLSLPVQALCRPDCRGICQSCGKNWNEGPCACASTKRDNPFDVLKKLKV